MPYLCPLMRIKAVKAIFLKEWIVERKNPHVIGGLFLYVVSTVFVTWLALVRLQNVPLWNALFWVIALFGVFNSSHRVFSQEIGTQQYYLHQMAKPLEVLFGKLLFSVLVNSILLVFTFVVFLWFFGWPGEEEGNWLALFATSFIGVLGLSGMLTLMSGIAYQAGNNPSLIAILGLPVVLPLLMLCIKVTKLILDGVAASVWSDYAFSLAGLTVAIIALASVLFPYLWSD